MTNVKEYLLFLVISGAICATTSVVAMNQDVKEETRMTPTIHFVLSPEDMKTINKMNFIASWRPQIAQEIPIITCAEEFEIAKAYLDLTKTYNQYLIAGAVNGPTINGTRSTLIETSQSLLKITLTYIDTLQGPSCKAFRSSEDEKVLNDSAYEAQYKIAQNHLMLLIATALTFGANNKSLEINAHITEIKRIKENLPTNFHYRKQLQQSIQVAQETVPALVPLFNPQAQLKPSHSSRQRGGRINAQRTVNCYEQTFQKLSHLRSQDSFQNLENFDSYFQINTKNIFNKYIALSLKQISHEDYTSQAQKLTDDYVAIEKRGQEFKTFVTVKSSSPPLLQSPSEELADLYRLFCQRYTLPNQNLLQLLKDSIFMHIQINKPEDALMRTEALKILLLEKGPLTEDFISFRASVMALNGDSGEWRKIWEEKKAKIQEEKTIAHKKQINQIKEQQEKIKKEIEKQKEIKKASQINTIHRERLKPDKTVDPEPEIISDSPASFITETKPEPLIFREKIKTRKPGQEPIDKEISLNCNNMPCKIVERSLSLKDYPVSGNALKIYQKIRRGDWKFPRQALCNLFSNLKCTVDMSQGKGCHGKISLPLNMIVTNAEGLVGVIPEFIQGETQNTLTVPDWDNKWSGIVPIYMRKSILSALDYLGATDKTVHKQNQNGGNDEKK